MSYFLVCWWRQSTTDLVSILWSALFLLFYVAQSCNKVLIFFLFESLEIYDWLQKQQSLYRYTKLSPIVPVEIAPGINVFVCFKYVFNIHISFWSSLLSLGWNTAASALNEILYNLESSEFLRAEKTGRRYSKMI